MYVPVIGQVLAAVALYVLGHDQEAGALLAAAAGTAGLGGFADPGRVR